MDMDLEGLSRWMKERNLKGHWEHQEWSQTVKPHLWKGKDVLEALNRAGELITTGEAGRRTIQMRNPGLAAGMTNTVHISVQLVKPGEIAAAHRHTAAAIRFIIKGTSNAYTIVEGERFPMLEGDFITTPNWTWHDHFNNSDEPVMWLDGLDVRLVTHFGAMIQENFKNEQQPVERPDQFSSKVFGHARPTWVKNSFRSPPYRYPWEETKATLEALKETVGDPCDGVLLEYSNPQTGGPTLPTFSCRIQLLRPKEKTRTHRHTSTTVYYAFRGRGITNVSSNEFNWDQTDIFVVPSWQWHSHANTAGKDAILFSITDQPASEALGLYREETAG
ncbi:MAG TPA: cupin domain-containing protein [Candidatus Binatia bacterium]|nr:cupin domain-containing protein [Candidatus Binatia bacterium]